MSLQFIIGGSGSGKSTYLYHMISKEAAEHRDQNYFVIVPDQFTLETQKTLVHMSGKKGILNVDVLSFHRLAYRVFEEVPALRKTVLEDMGKTMLLRKVLSEQKDNLQYFRRGLYQPGFLDECKSFMCELMQYAITEDSFDKMEDILSEENLMAWKLQDIRLIYRALQEKMGDVYMMSEELIPQLTGVVSSIPMLKDSVICLDGFTGFTPTQYELLGELLRVCSQMIVTVTTDRTQKRTSVFSMSNETIKKLSGLAGDMAVGIEEPVVTGYGTEKIPYRLKNSGQLAFLEKNIFSYAHEKWEEEVTDLRLRICRKESEEAAFVAREIAHLVREEGYRYDDIAVVTGDLAAYESSLAREFDRMRIRYFMDYKKSIGANALAEYIMAFLAMVRKNMDADSTFRFLRSGLSPLAVEETDILENYVLARGRRGYRSYQQEWEYEVKRIDLVAVNEYRRKFMASIEEAVKSIRGGKKSVRTFAEILYQLIVKNHLFEKIREKSRSFEESGELILAHEYKSIYRLMMDLLDEMVELLGDEMVSLREFEELLGAGISEGLVGFVPPESDQVMVGDVERSRLKNIRILFFVGASDDRIPKSRGSAGLLSESEREKLSAAGIELAPLPEKQSETEQFYLYLTLTKPSERLYISCSRMGDDGSSKRLSYLFRSLKNLFPSLSFEDDEKENSLNRVLGTDGGMTYFVTHLADGSFENDRLWWELAAHFRKENPELLKRLTAVRKEKKAASKLSKETAELLYGETIYGSVSRLEMFARCPYAHYVIYGLGLRDREQFQMSTMDYGTIFHACIEHVSHVLSEQEKSWEQLEEAEIEKLAEESVDFAVKDFRGNMLFSSHRMEFVIRRIKRVMNRTIWGLWRQMAEGAFVQKYSEKSFVSEFKLDADKKMALHGVIDRMDVCEWQNQLMIKIMDYKSSARELSLDRVYYGLQLQLFAYMQAAMELEKKTGKEIIPAAMLYYHVKEPCMEWVKESEAERRLREMREFRCGGYVNEAPEILERIDTELAREGELSAGSNSAIVPVSVKKNMTFAAGTHVMSTGQFEQFIEHTEEKIKEFGNQIYEGEIGAMPYRMDSHTGCEYCGLRGICGREDKYSLDEERVFKPMKEEEVWEVMHEHDTLDSGSEENH